MAIAMSDTQGVTARVKKPLYKDLLFQVIVAIILGVLVGYYFPKQAVEMKPLGDGFIKLIKMMIAPIIFCTVVSGIAHVQDSSKVGRVGIKALFYFEIVSTVALVLGLIVG
ncbi:MAG: cation:dicarboxylase symporter family transporter, partial [Rickettsiales bacterium]|nr:cation:dicarboxylase symporter family transporter [Rickettsiales bacterium]